MFGNDLFKPASMESETGEEITLNSTENDMNITEAVQDLQASGCVFTDYKNEYSDPATIKLDFKAFKEKALDRELVFTVETSDSLILLVLIDGEIFEWNP